MDTDLSSAPPPKQTNWWLIGCGGCLALIVLGVLGLGGLFFGAMKVVKSSESYKMAETAAKNSPEVQEELGTPITTGMMMQGKVNTNSNNGVTTETADITLPLKGPKGSASLHYVAEKADGKWNVSVFTVTVDGSGKVITLNPQH